MGAVNGMLLNEKKVYVGKFLSRAERLKKLGERAKLFTNVYIKNFGETLDEDQLKEMFANYGVVKSVAVMKDGNGASKGFGFVAMENHEEAQKACENLNGKETEGVTGELYVGRAQKKQERATELRTQFEQQKQARIEKYIGVNLYVKNLDDTVDDNKLREAFTSYGTITSAKIMSDGDKSKGFGFVCFSSPEEATKAVTEMNGRIVGSKPLYVALAQRREERKAHLTAQYMQRMNNGVRVATQPPGQMIQGHHQYSAQPGFYQVATPYPQRQVIHPSFVSPRWTGGRGHAPSNYPLTQYGPGMNGGDPNAIQGRGPLAGMRAPAMRTLLSSIANNRQHPHGAPMAQHQHPMQTMQQHQHQQQQFKYTNAVRNTPMPQQYQQQAGAPVQQQQQQQQQHQQQQPAAAAAAVHAAGQEPLTLHMLAAAGSSEQKQMIGESLYPLIDDMHSSMASKITGMLLEIDNADLLHMLDHRESLKLKVDEAVSVLNAHQQKVRLAAARGGPAASAAAPADAANT